MARETTRFARARDAEIWMQPHPWTTVEALRELIERRDITVTPRLGVRDKRNPKGYAIGERVMLRLLAPLDSFEVTGTREVLSVPVEITGLVVRQLSALTAEDLMGCEPGCRDWKSVQRTLRFFARRELPGDTMVTVVRFAYVDERDEKKEERYE